MISVVITLFNGADTLAQQLDALTAQEYDGEWEVVMLDNGSTDASVEIARQYESRLPGFRVEFEHVRRGRPFALNAGVQASHGEIVLMTDQDDEVGHGWLRGMADAFSQGSQLVGCSIDHHRLNPPVLDWSQQKSRLPRLWFPPHLPYAAGTSLGFRRGVFEAVGGFDTSLRFVQDVEFCLQAQLRGFRLDFVAAAVLHYRRRTRLRDHYQQARCYARESAILARRYWPRGQPTKPLYRNYARDWCRVGRQAIKARTDKQRYEFVWELGRQVGRTQGALIKRGLPV